MTATLTLERLNAAPPQQFVDHLRALFEHSPWVVERAAARRPFRSLAHLKHALAQVVRDAGRDAQLALLRAHPELAGKAMATGTMTQASTSEQSGVGLDRCTPEELAELRELNAAYQAKFGFPFMLAVRGPRGTGLTRAEIVATFRRRLADSPESELDEGLRNVLRVVELRLHDLLGDAPRLGELVWDWAQALARWSDPGFAERGELTVTYLTDAHRACAAWLRDTMREAGFDDVSVDAVGNVVGVSHGTQPEAPRLLTGSHYDTVRNGGRYDGRLGILVPMACVRELASRGRRLPYAIELVAFAEEEGQRYRAAFLGSSALVGAFDPAWLDQVDAQGVTMRDAMRAAGLPGTMAAIAALARDAQRYRAFVEVHIEQGPVLASLDLPLGVVTSINGNVRLVGEVRGVASHAGTTPMGQRRDAAAAAAEIVLAIERRASAVPEVVGTVGMLEVPNGSINVVPGRCRMSLDIRATTDPVRDACVADVLAEIGRIGERRGVEIALDETVRVPAAPSDATWQARWERAVDALGVPVHRMPSGAGHDAMKLHTIMPQAMLFVRGLNRGISHNPLESITTHDAELAVRAMLSLLEHCD